VSRMQQLGVEVSPKRLRIEVNSALLTVLAYLCAVGLAETALALGWLVASLLLHVGILLTALAQFALQPQRVYARVLPALSLVSLLRILSMTLVVNWFDAIWLNPLVCLPLLVGIGLTLRLLELTPQQVGLSPLPRGWQGLIAASGVPLGLGLYWLSKPAPPEFPSLWLFLFAGVALFLTGFVEELLFRGLVTNVLLQFFGLLGLALATILFGFMYLGTLSPGLILWMLGFGFCAGLCLKHTQSILGIGIAHGIMNVVALLLLPWLIPT